MEEQDWLILKVLYQKKNITKTAQSLYISQPTITKRIQRMEKEFKLTILHRGPKGVQFTSQGEYLARCADEMLDRLREIKETVQNMEQEVSGTLRLGVSNYITRHKLPRLLMLFREKFPNVNFKITTGWSHEVFQLIYHQDVHVGIVRGDYHWSESKQLLMEEEICITSKEKIDLDVLPSLPKIEYDTDPLLKTLVDNWWSGNYSQPPLIGMEVDKADTCKEMVMNGLGYGILPSALVDHYPDLHKIHLKDEKGDSILRRTWMLYHQETLNSKLINEFVKFISKLDFKNL